MLWDIFCPTSFDCVFPNNFFFFRIKCVMHYLFHALDFVERFLLFQSEPISWVDYMRILFKDCTWWSANYWMPEIPTRDFTSHFWTRNKIPIICLVQGTKYQRNTKYLFKLRMASSQRIDKIPMITGYYVVRLRWVDYTQPSPQHVMPSVPSKTIHLREESN